MTAGNKEGLAVSRSLQARHFLSFSAVPRIWLVLCCLAASIFPASATLRGQGELEAQWEQARLKERAGDYAAAERVYEQALAVAPGNPETLKRLGVLQQTELKFDESIDRFKQVLDYDARYAEVNFFLGVSYFGKNEFPLAIESFRHELETAKPHRRCRYYLALAYQSAGRLDEAISQFNRMVAENPQDEDALYQLARIYKNASVQAMERLRALDQDSFQLHALMGEVYADEERYPEAIKEYHMALHKRPGAPGIHYAIGVAYWAQHQMDAARTEFMNALQENRSDALTNLYLGDIAVHEGRFQEALTYLRIAEKVQPNMSQVHLLLGKCYRGQNAQEDARREFLAAIKADPTAAEPHYLLAQVYRELHNPQASASEFEEFERLSKLEREKALQPAPQN
jgi:tetratricopeptide (TPR) repeat protein